METLNNPSSLVQLPVMDADQTIALATALITAGKKKKLPATLSKHLPALEAATKTIEKAAKRHKQAKDTKSKQRGSIDLDADLYWSVLFQVTLQWLRLEDRELPYYAPSAVIKNAWFAGGLAPITQVSMDKQYVQMQQRLSLLQPKSELHEAVKTLGLQPLVNALQQLLPEYGDLANVTSTNTTQPTSLREPLRELQAQLRNWIFRIHASVDPDDNNSLVRANRLLAPLRLSSQRSHDRSVAAKRKRKTASNKE